MCLLLQRKKKGDKQNRVFAVADAIKEVKE